MQPRCPVPVALAIALLTVSDTRTLADDRSGDALQQRLEAAGHRLVERSLAPTTATASAPSSAVGSPTPLCRW
jgi:molybdopterin biosynthesis enzyme MoaB